MAKIAIYGGSFNPIHFGHVSVVNLLLSIGGFDEVIVVPCNKHAFNKELVDAEHRFAMVKLALDHFDKQNLIISKYEIDQNITYTYDAVKHYKDTTFSSDQLYLVMGMDVFDQFPKFYKSDEILKMAKLHVLPRNTDLLPKISSSIIRTAFACDEINKNNFPFFYLNKDVYNYIIKNNLYSDKS